MLRTWKTLLTSVTAAVVTLASSAIPGTVRAVYPGTEDCGQGCAFAEQTPLERSTVVELVQAAVALNASHGSPTDLNVPRVDRAA